MPTDVPALLSRLDADAKAGAPVRVTQAEADALEETHVFLGHVDESLTHTERIAEAYGWGVLEVVGEGR